MNSLRWTCLGAVFTVILSQPACSEKPAVDDLGPPTVDQAPPFPVPKTGYEVEGRPGLMRNIPYIGFVAWESFEGPGIPAGLQRRLLSQSPSMGAVAQITYIPAGWSHPAGYHDVDHEFFVLEGDLTIGDGAGEEKLTKYSYSYMPAGETHRLKSRQGAVLLDWWKGKPDFVASNQDKKGARDYARVRAWSYFKTPWYVGEPFPPYRTGGNFPRFLHKLLRKDPDTGEMTLMEFDPSIPAPPSDKPSNFGGGYEIHPSFEEYYHVEGNRQANVDDRGPHKSEYGGECVEPGLSRYTNGARGYFWRAAGVAHGGGRRPPSPGDSDGDAGFSWSILRTGTRLWATYVTDCTYKTGIEYMGDGRWRKYDYNVPRYNPQK